MSNPNRFKIPYLYKLLMLLVIIIGPIYWLMLTEDGQRRTDIVVLTLAGEPSVEMRLDVLTPDVTEEDFRVLYPDVEWKCEERGSEFGERQCGTRLAAFNDAPAYLMLLHFEGERLAAMEVLYRSRYQNWLLKQIRHSLGPEKSEDNSGGLSKVLEWRTDKGIFLLPAHVDRARREKPAFIWISHETAGKRAEALRSGQGHL